MSKKLFSILQYAFFLGLGIFFALVNFEKVGLEQHYQRSVGCKLYLPNPRDADAGGKPLYTCTSLENIN